VVSPSGTVVARDWRVFKTEAYRDASQPFSSVTLLTHGFQLSPTAPANVAESIAAFIEMAENIARAGGEGVAALYQKTTGRWLVFYNGATFETNVDLESVLASPAMAGKPVVLVSDWFNESDFPTNGFSEAAADALYSALARLNFNVGDNKLFDSPIHLIGHSRGTVVNSEIAQRFGIYAKAVRLTMTSLDVHDFNQPSLDIPVGEYICSLFGAGLSALGVPALGTLTAVMGSAADQRDHSDRQLPRSGRAALEQHRFRRALLPDSGQSDGAAGRRRHRVDTERPLCAEFRRQHQPQRPRRLHRRRRAGDADRPQTMARSGRAARTAASGAGTARPPICRR
jgi:hypothetical protein